MEKIRENCMNPDNHTHNLYECTRSHELVRTAYVGYMASEAAGTVGRLLLVNSALPARGRQHPPSCVRLHNCGVISVDSSL